MREKIDKRIPCVVPFCRRTAPNDGGNDHEIICQKHWKLVAKETRRLHLRILKKATTFLDAHPDPLILPESERAFGLRLIRISNRIWKRVKSEAIEAAGGIG